MNENTNTDDAPMADDGITMSDRLALAMDTLRLTWERRDGFVSDDDVLDAAEQWADPYDWESENGGAGFVQYATLRDLLFGILNENN